MMASSSRSKVLQLYKQMMREGQKFPNYNFRMYALRRVQDGFKEYKDEGNSQKIEDLVQRAEQDLETMRRQSQLGQLYKPLEKNPTLVVEGQKSS